MIPDRARACWKRLLQSCAVAAFTMSGPGTGTHLPAPMRSYQAFWVQGQHGAVRVNCLRLYQAPQLRLFDCPGNSVAASDARAMATTFETHILPTDTNLFGTPHHLFPVTVLFVPLPSSTLGYFDENDVNPDVVSGDPAHSNRANVLYVRYPDTMPDADRLADTDEVIAHELQHLIDYRLRVIDMHLAPQQDWLNEGLSFYAQIANDYWTPRDVLKVQAAMRSPWWPVTSLRPDLAFMRHNARLAYGRAGLFTTYLATQFGTKFIRQLEVAPRPGFEGIDALIRRYDPHEDLPTLYSDWAVAQYLRGSGRYGYPGEAAAVWGQPSMVIPTVTNFPFDSNRLNPRSLSLQPWGQEFVRLSTKDNGDLSVSVAGPKQLRVAVIFEDSNGVISPHIRWLRAGSNGILSIRYSGFGGFYDRATLAITNVGSLQDAGVSKPEEVRVQATLTDVRNGSNS